MKQVDVGLGERSYPIFIQEGLIAGIGADLQKRQIGKRYVIIADDSIAAIYGQTVVDSLSQAGLSSDLITFQHGEENKNLSTIGQLTSKLAQLGVDRKDCLIALGGGVTGDITGFVAAIYMRGIPFVQVPTTLLAQVDSSVGGKTGVDIPEGKNLVGCFYQPRAVYIDSNVLKTLPNEELLNGLAEVIKYGVIHDADFFTFLKEERQHIQALDLSVLENVIERCCEIKAEIVAADERESDLRRILNFGHTLGHAVEATSQFTIAHGLAVAMGMVTVSRIAVEHGLLMQDTAVEIMSLIESYGLPTTIPANIDRQQMKEFLKTDKKTVAGTPFFVLPIAIGTVIISDDVNEDLIDKVINN
jgi:3-dehydroquinate synthase